MKTIQQAIKQNLTAGIIMFLLIILLVPATVMAQTVSPRQGGHYVAAFGNIRDYSKVEPGLVFTLYNQYAYSSKYFDIDGNKYSSIPLDQIYPELPPVDLNIKLNTFSMVPGISWGSTFKFLGGARYTAQFTPVVVFSGSSFVTEQRGGTIDSTYNASESGRLNGFSDLFAMPLGLSWGFDHHDATFFYGFTAPTGRYATGADDNLGLGFWTHQFQAFYYYYPKVNRSTATTIGLTYELNSMIKDADVKPGGRLSLDWGISQFVTEKLEIGIQGGSTWQVTDDKGDDVYWDASLRDRKSTFAFNLGGWMAQGTVNLNFKYMVDYRLRQTFQNHGLMLNLVVVTQAGTGKHLKKNKQPQETL